MSGHAHLRRGKVKRDLDGNDHEDVHEALFGERGMAMAKEKCRPGANDSHHATRCAHELAGIDQTDHGQADDARARADTRKQVAKRKSERADGSFQRRPKHE